MENYVIRYVSSMQGCHSNPGIALKSVKRRHAQKNAQHTPSHKKICYKIIFQNSHLGRLLKDGQGKLQNEVYVLRPQILMRGCAYSSTHIEEEGWVAC